MRPLSRRQLLQSSGLGFGMLALADMLRAEGGAASSLAPKSPHFPGRARAIIQLVQNGGPSQMDLFDPKPELQRLDGKVHTVKVDTFQPGS